MANRRVVKTVKMTSVRLVHPAKRGVNERCLGFWNGALAIAMVLERLESAVRPLPMPKNKTPCLSTRSDERRAD